MNAFQEEGARALSLLLGHRLAPIPQALIPVSATLVTLEPDFLVLVRKDKKKQEGRRRRI